MKNKKRLHSFFGLPAVAAFFIWLCPTKWGDYQVTQPYPKKWLYHQHQVIFNNHFNRKENQGK